MKQASAFRLNTALRSYLKSGNPTLALHHYLEASHKHGVTPDKFTIPSLLKLFLHLGYPVKRGESLQSFSLKNGFLYDLFIATGLIEFYLKHAASDSAHKLFVEIPKRDVVLFTAMICGLSENGFRKEALDLFFEMKEERIEPTAMTIAAVFSIISQCQNIDLGRMLHGFCLRKGFLNKKDAVLQTSLMDMYGKCRNLVYAANVFDKITERNLASWNSIINAFVSHGSLYLALKLFQEMIFQGWLRPKTSTFTSILNACGLTTDLSKGRELHAYITKCIDADYSEFDKLVLCNALIDMYFKTGNCDSAQTFFDKMQMKNVVTWTTMISGQGSHGLTRRALETFNRMIASGIKPDRVAFVAILTACNHGGLVKEGRQIFDSMENEFNVSPEMIHYVCMVDLYSRRGLLEEAHILIKGMPFEPSKEIWGVLLSCCRSYRNVQLGEYAAKMALELDKFDAGTYVLLSRLYVESGRLEEFSKVRLAMQQLGLRPIRAFSWVEMKNKVYKFTVGERFNESSKEMYEFLESVSLKMEEAGIQRDVSNVGHDFSKRDKVGALCGHTEKLALAFAMVKFESMKNLRIGKNLRVCIDCHEVFKFVSLVYEKEIVLKDPNRYHRFIRGHCTCNDFW
ncbi:Pentatricopeptide repeat-containing protein [Rhynchospora pubera]|uniref:Pentatricopeptide repeat-containing protein n=1 Tax=Rhynchospora pubera TaxID=906938 RepID=A0AAV8EH13_9POAL|nr:Pentatricopeptide repeat-containing protein [Rhynchospora pubera]